MNTEEIKKIRAGKEKARIYNFECYQSTGDTRYYRAEKRYADLVELCDQALSVSEDRDKARRLSSEFMILARKASQMRHEGGYMDPQEVKDFLYEFGDVAERFGFQDPYS